MLVLTYSTNYLLVYQRIYLLNQFKTLFILSIRVILKLTG